MAAILENSELVAEYRARLTNLSWLMKSPSAPIAREANAEDKVTGRLWGDRFKSQALLSEKSILAAITPASHPEISSFTKQERANQLLMPLIGVKSFNVSNLAADTAVHDLTHE